MWIHVCVWANKCHSTPIEVRTQCEVVGSLHPSRRCQGSNSTLQPWWQVPSLHPQTESFYRKFTLIFCVQMCGNVCACSCVYTY